MKDKFLIGIFALAVAAFLIFSVLRSNDALLIHPKGIIARNELRLISANILLMLVVAVPALVLLYVFAGRYRAGNPRAKYEAEQKHGVFQELVIWIFPAAIVVTLAVITWNAAHALDPYKPLDTAAKPLTIQVVALDWKWLFIYPRQGIASVNFLEFPERAPIDFALTADGAPMNSFWIPQLGGQMYAMPGMTTILHLMADSTGDYAGRAAEINGQGLSGMTFTAKSVSREDFDKWVMSVRQSPQALTNDVYAKLVESSENNPAAFYSSVEKDLYRGIVMKFMSPASGAETKDAMQMPPGMKM